VRVSPELRLLQLTAALEAANQETQKRNMIIAALVNQKSDRTLRITRAEFGELGSWHWESNCDPETGDTVISLKVEMLN
jgi:hypothetical protein